MKRAAKEPPPAPPTTGAKQHHEHVAWVHGGKNGVAGSAQPFSTLARHARSYGTLSKAYTQPLVGTSVDRLRLPRSSRDIFTSLTARRHASTAAPLASAVTQTMSAAQVSDAVQALPFHNVERTLGVYDPEVLPEVMHHLVDIWSVVKIEELIVNLHASAGTATG